jgi:predicted transposase/invertase (TIGR01784 family)
MFQKVASVLVTEYGLVDDSEYYHHRYELIDPEHRSRFTDKMEFGIIELNKLPEESDGSAAWQWAKFLKSVSEEEIRSLAAENESIGKAVLILEKLSEDEQARQRAEYEEMMRRDYVSRINGARKEGLEAGIERGRAEGHIEDARRMKADGMDFALITKYTGLTAEEIMEL